MGLGWTVFVTGFDTWFYGGVGGGVGIVVVFGFYATGAFWAAYMVTALSKTSFSLSGGSSVFSASLVSLDITSLPLFEGAVSPYFLFFGSIW